MIIILNIYGILSCGTCTWLETSTAFITCDPALLWFLNEIMWFVTGIPQHRQTKRCFSIVFQNIPIAHRSVYNLYNIQEQVQQHAGIANSRWVYFCFCFRHYCYYNVLPTIYMNCATIEHSTHSSRTIHYNISWSVWSNLYTRSLL